MNKTEKLICLVLGAVLAWYIFSEMGRSKEVAKQAAAVQTNVVAQVSIAANADATLSAQPSSDASLASEPVVAKDMAEKAIVLHDSFVSISNEQEIVTFAANERGVAIKSITLLEYAQDVGKVSAENPPVTLDFGEHDSRALVLNSVPQACPNGGKVTFKADSPTSVIYDNGQLVRRFSLVGDYRIAVEETFKGIDKIDTSHCVGLGVMRMGDSKNDLLSVDSWALDAGKGKPGVIHHGDDDSPLKAYLVGGFSGGCSGSKSAVGMPKSTRVNYPGAQTWIAVKNRFFVTALASCSEPNAGFSASIARDVSAANYRPESVTAGVCFNSLPEKRTMVFYAGPKKQSFLWDLGMKDVMEFGMWRWLCYPLVWVLNLFNGWIPNFGIAIILLTILVRLLFWPLTHKSTVGMRKMQELQPLMKEIQAKYKNNPQRLQQETWQLYREKKVNPMSSCLPMLIQIPVFIALFNVLRSAVELRYASFLWISDLSEPEGLFASFLPFGGLNLLPILMAVTTGLQSAFTPSTGDRNQQKMMMVFMPIMMLVMFYSFPSALSLYWFLSNLFSIVQMWLIRRETAKKQEALMPEVIDPPVTRQMRRHG